MGMLIESPELYISHVVKQAGGNPQAITDLLDASAKERRVDKRQIRELRHGAGVKYLDFTPVMIVASACLIGARYLVIGLGDTALYILAGMAAALFLSLRVFLFKGAGHHWYTLELEATNTLTLAHVTCDCPVLGVWQQGLIVLHEGRPRAVGLSQVHHDLYPLNAKLIEGAALSVASYRVDMRGRSLGWLLERIDLEWTYYLSGELRIGARLKRR